MNPDHFDQLNLSYLLLGRQSSELIKLCEFNQNDRFKLLYRGSRDGFGANHFHLKCDGHENTLTLFKASETAFIFGAFTSTIWNSSNQYKSDSNAFLFSLTNKENQPCKMKIDPNKHKYASYYPSDFGPIFGGGHDICIYSNSNANNASYSNLGHTYKHHYYDFNTLEAKTFLAGSLNFQLSEIEVYQRV